MSMTDAEALQLLQSSSCFRGEVCAALPCACAETMARTPLKKRPVAFRVKDFADGWVIFQSEEVANFEAEKTGAVMQGLYVRDGT